MTLLHATPDARRRRAELDAVIFDTDGVLLDIAQSIRPVNCLAVAFYLREILGWPVPDTLISSADIELFKHAGGFNDDWDLTYALVLYFLAKGREHPHASAESLRVMRPTLTQYAGRIKERGGWLRAAEAICLENLSRDARIAVEQDYRKPVIRQVFQELWGGEFCPRLYGFAPEYYRGPAYIHKDRVLIDLALLPNDKILGVQTGRTYEEAMLGLEFTKLDTVIPETSVVTKRDGFHKPEPGGLALLAQRMQFQSAIYIGDTLDDLRTVRNFNAKHSGASFLGALVLTGPAGDANRPLFEKAGADIIASDVNDVLAWINAPREPMPPRT